jgi:Tsi6
MTNAERVRLFESAMEAMQKLEAQYPSYPPFVSIHNQLLYLIQVCSSPVERPVDLSQINLGYIAMREVEPRDEDAANLLYSVAAEVDEMKKPRYATH